MNEFRFPKVGFAQIQSKIESLVENNNYLETLSRGALKSFMHSYSNYSLKEIFDLKKIDRSSLFKSFGIQTLKKNVF